MIQDANCRLLRYMRSAMYLVPVKESSVINFVVYLLHMLGYVTRSRMAKTRLNIPLLVCGETSVVTADVCIVNTRIMNPPHIMLLVEEDKRHMRPHSDPEAQLVAKALAAFQVSNKERSMDLGQDSVAGRVIPGILFTGSSPIFYKIPVTAELASAVARGVYPSTPTVVYAHIPPAPPVVCRLSEGLEALDCRTQILRCFEAFKQYIS